MKTSMKQVLEGMVDIPPTTPNPKSPGEQEALINKTKVNDSPGDKEKQDGQPEKKQPGIRWEFTDEVEHFHADKPSVPDVGTVSSGLSMAQKRFSVDESKNLAEMLDLGDHHSKELDKHKKLMKSNRNSPERHNYHKARVNFHAGVLEKLDKVPEGTYANESEIIDQAIIDLVLNEVAPPGAVSEGMSQLDLVKAWRDFRDTLNEAKMSASDLAYLRQKMNQAAGPWNVGDATMPYKGTEPTTIAKIDGDIVHLANGQSMHKSYLRKPLDEGRKINWQSQNGGGVLGQHGDHLYSIDVSDDGKSRHVSFGRKKIGSAKNNQEAKALAEKHLSKKLNESEFWGRKPNASDVDVVKPRPVTPPAGHDLHSALSMSHRTGKSLKLYFSDGDHVMIDPTIAREIIAKKSRHHINSAMDDDSLTRLLCDVMDC